MSDNTLQGLMQPFVKLAQSNMELVSRFSNSSEVTSATVDQAQDVLQRGQETALKLFQSNAFANLMQGMIKNYVEFLADVGQNSMSMMVQGQQTMVKQAQQASQQVTDVAESQVRRARQAA